MNFSERGPRRNGDRMLLVSSFTSSYAILFKYKSLDGGMMTLKVLSLIGTNKKLIYFELKFIMRLARSENSGHRIFSKCGKVK